MKTRIMIYTCLVLLLCVGLIYVAKRKQQPTGLSAGRRVYTIEEEEFEPVDERDQISHVMVVESSPDHLMLDIFLQEPSFEEVEMADGNVYTRVIDPGAGIYKEGMPDVPVFGNWILIPNGTEPELDIDPGEPIVYENIDIPPLQPSKIPLEEEIEIPFNKDYEVYNTDTDYPGVFAELEPKQIMRGQECTILWIYPYQYNPVRRMLLVYPDIKVTAHFVGEPHPIPENLRSEAFDLLMERVALNGDAVISIGRDEEGWTGEIPTLGGPYGWDYIIISYFTLDEYAKKFALWKKKCGFKPLVVLVPYGLTAEDVRNLIKKAYDNWDIKPQYVLLLGDSWLIPCFYKTNYASFSPKIRDMHGYIGSDFYYSTMGEPGDIMPDIAVGRLSVNSLQKANDFVDRIINYEKAPVLDYSFYNNITLCTYFGDKIDKKTKKPDGRADDCFARATENLAIFLSESKYGVKKKVNRIYYTEPDRNPEKWDPAWDGGLICKSSALIPSYLRKPTFAWDGKASYITSAIQKGTFLVTYFDHGNRGGWLKPSFTKKDASLLTNNASVPVVWSMSCQSGWFDNETDFKKMTWLKDWTSFSDSCFAEEITCNSKGGAVGVIAATRSTTTYTGELLLWSFTDAIWPNFLSSYCGKACAMSIRRMGDILNYGKLFMITKMPQSNSLLIQISLDAFLWFGDPAMEIRTEKPNFLYVELPPRNPWVLRPTELAFHIVLDVIDSDDPHPTDEIPSPLGGATVTISKEDTPSDYWVGKVNENGDVIFPDFIASDLGEYDIVVTASNCIPYQGTLVAEVGPAGGILLNVRPFEVEVRLADADLAGMEIQDVFVSTTGGDEENVTLRETEIQAGMFTGTIPTDFSGVIPGDGILQVHEGEMILADYYDEDDGSGMSVGVHDEKLFEPEPPVFEGFDYVMVDNDCVELQ